MRLWPVTHPLPRAATRWRLPKILVSYPLLAFNTDLELAAISTEVVKRIGSESDTGTEISRVMRQISGRLAQNSTGDVDFEVLVGAFGLQSGTLEHSGALAEMVAPNDKAPATAIGVTTAFARRVRDTGISHVLEVIFERSHARADLADGLNEFVRSVTQCLPEAARTFPGGRRDACC